MEAIEGIGFSTPDDLPANLDGRLSDSQIHALEAMQRHTATGGILSTLILAVTSLLFAQLVPFVTDVVGVVVLVVAFSVPPVVLTLLEYRRLQADISGGQVSHAEGIPNLDQRGFLRMGEWDLRVSREEARRLQPHINENIRIVYIPRSKLIVGAYRL